MPVYESTIFIHSLMIKHGIVFSICSSSMYRALYVEYFLFIQLIVIYIKIYIASFAYMQPNLSFVGVVLLDRILISSLKQMIYSVVVYRLSISKKEATFKECRATYVSSSISGTKFWIEISCRCRYVFIFLHQRSWKTNCNASCMCLRSSK